MDNQEITFESDGVTLHGMIERPESPGPHPVVILSHGLSGLASIGLDLYSRCFVEAGIACLTYDHRNWGKSGGWPRCETDPWRQVADMREAVSVARNLADIDGERLGIWGTSYSGGHVLTVAALDKRVRCVVSQVPLISGSRTFEAWVPEDKRTRFLERLGQDRDARASGFPPLTTQAATPGSETEEWIERCDDGSYVNALTVRSFDLLRSYEPISFMEEIAPTPLLMIVAENDTQTPTAWQIEAIEKSGEPKQLLRLDCRHYDVYMDRLPEAANAARDWFIKYLK